MAFEKRSTDVKVEATVSKERTRIACGSCGILHDSDKQCSNQCETKKNVEGDKREE